GNEDRGGRRYPKCLVDGVLDHANHLKLLALKAAHGDLPAERASLPEVPLSKRLIHQRHGSGARRIARSEFAPQEHGRAQRLEIAPGYGVEVNLIAAYGPPVDEDVLRDSAAGQRSDHGITGRLHTRRPLNLLEQAVIERGSG